MNNQRNAADRVRPFLQAMEKSIMAARQRRLNDRPGAPTAAPGIPAAPAPTSATPPAPTPDDVPAPSIGEDGRPRLRARPKRPAGAMSGFDNGDSGSNGPTP